MADEVFSGIIGCVQVSPISVTLPEIGESTVTCVNHEIAPSKLPNSSTTARTNSALSLDVLAFLPVQHCIDQVQVAPQTA